MKNNYQKILKYKKLALCLYQEIKQTARRRYKMKKIEKILRIEKGVFAFEKNPVIYEGFQIVTSQQTIKIGINNEQNCCENFGCIITNDDTADFIGAKLLSISITDTALNNKQLTQLECLDSGGAMFVNIETTNGLLQFVAYNAHNGYYGHESVLVSKQLNHTECI